MENYEDFVIEEGVLKKYRGNGGRVVIPEGVTIIGEEAFFCCESLTEVVIPKGVREIENAAFCFCEGLTELTIPEGVTYIGVEAFQDCRSLRRVVLPESLQVIAHGAFDNLAALTEIHIPDGVTRIGCFAFAGCWELSGSVVIPEGVKEISGRTFEYCYKLSSVTLPESLVTIHLQSFMHCRSLREITIPANVKKIWIWAFLGCCSLRKITILGKDTAPVFDSQEPFERVDAPIIAPNMPLENMFGPWKYRAALGFAMEQERFSEERQEEYREYIAGQGEQLYPFALQHEELLRWMFAEKLVTREDVQTLLDTADRLGLIDRKAAVLRLSARTFEPVDPTKDFWI